MLGAGGIIIIINIFCKDFLTSAAVHPTDTPLVKCIPPTCRMAHEGPVFLVTGPLVQVLQQVPDGDGLALDVGARSMGQAIRNHLCGQTAVLES